MAISASCEIRNFKDCVRLKLNGRLICRFLTLRAERRARNKKFKVNFTAARGVWQPHHIYLTSFSMARPITVITRGPQKISQTRLGAEFSRAPRQKMITRASEGGPRERWMDGQGPKRGAHRGGEHHSQRSTAFLSSTHGHLLYIEPFTCLCIALLLYFAIVAPLFYQYIYNWTLEEQRKLILGGFCPPRGK